MSAAAMIDAGEFEVKPSGSAHSEKKDYAFG
jgi:hypothetical protein